MKGLVELKAAKAMRLILVVAAATSLWAALADAEDGVTPDEIMKALRPGASGNTFIKSRQPESRPTVDLEITFDYNSADISVTSIPALQELGKALTSERLKGETFIIAGHADAVGGEAFNQDLSERRANSVKQYLVEKFGIAEATLIAVGFGQSKPKNPDDPADPVNRRVQILNMETRTGTK